MSNKKLLILDLDETLIHSVEKPLERKPDFSFDIFHTYKRPFLEKFLKFCFEYFEVAVWTSATNSYALEILKNILNQNQIPTFVWTRNRCTLSFDEELRESFLTKKMWKVKRKGYDLTKVVVIDDRPEQWRSSYGNLIRVKEYLGEKEDNELRLLTKYLEKIKDVEDVRQIEKRGWRNSLKTKKMS